MIDLAARAEKLFGLPWSREITADQYDGYLARVPELPGCIAQGTTVAEALINLDVMVRDWLVSSLECGDVIAQPRRNGFAVEQRRCVQCGHVDAGTAFR